MADGGDDDMPRDAKVVKELLKLMSVEDYEPRVIQQFLELWYRYVADVLTDAHVYSEHAGKSTVDSDDVKLAIQSKRQISQAEETEEDGDSNPNLNPNPNRETQDQRDLPQRTPQRVSFPLGAKNTR